MSVSRVSLEIDRCFRIFNLYNNTRLGIIRRLTPPRRFKLVSLIPYLLHVNALKLPGYIPDLGDGAGLHGFRLTDEMRALRKEYFMRENSTGPQGLPKIASLALIGSSGTMAQEDNSDFDFWLTCENSVTDAEYSMIHQKAQGIERWLYEMDPDLEVNIYMGTPDKIKDHYFGAVSDDGAGSALGKMLKEEFYRTCVCWTGKVPFWWCVPGNIRTPEDYGKWWDGFKASNLPFAQDIMDMGPLERSTTEQFLSAVLWQTNKALKQPFKSILKLSLVNSYADNPDGELLAEKVRDLVQVNPQGDSADPYMMLFETCADYWRSKRKWDAVRMMAEGYYTKTIVGKSAKAVNEASNDDIIFRRRRVIRDLMHEWGLDQAAQINLNKQAEWDFSTAFEYRERSEDFVKAIFDRTIFRLEEMGVKFVKGQVVRSNDQVSEGTLSLLRQFSNIGHKVDCFYGRSAKKVEPITPGFQDMLAQQSYSLIFESNLPRSQSWILSQDLYSRSPSGRIVRSDESSIVDLVDESEEPVPTPSDTKPATKGFLDDVTDFLTASDGAGDTIAPSGKRSERPTRAVTEANNPAGNTTSTGSERTRSRKDLILGKSPLYIAAWLAANHLANANSEIRLLIDGERKAAGEIRKLVGRFASFFRHKLYQDKLPESTFEQPPKPYKYFIYFDLLSHTQFKIQSRVYRRSTGVGTNSDENSGVRSISILEQDTYGVIRDFEVPASRYSPAMLMARLLAALGHLDSEEFSSNIQIQGAGTPFYDNFVKEYTEALKRAHAEFRSNTIKAGEDLRFVTRIDDEYYVILRREDGTFDADILRDMRMLLSYLEQPLEKPTRTIVDAVAKGPEHLRAVLSRWVPGLIQVYVSRRQSEPASGSLLLLDEAGGFYHEVFDAGDLDAQYGGMTLFIARLNRAELPFAARKDGKLAFRGWNMMESGGGLEGNLSYHIEPLPNAPTQEMAKILGELVYVKLHGTLNLNDPHRAELIARGELRRIVLPADSLVATLAESIAGALAEFECRDFCIVELGGAKLSVDAKHSLEYLTMRRALDRTLRRIIMSKTTSKKRRKASGTGSTARNGDTGGTIANRGATRRHTDSNIIRARNPDSME